MAQDTFLRTFSTVEPIGPAEAWDSGTTTGDGSTNQRLIETGQNFTSAIIAGMIAVNTTDGVARRIVEVIDDENLLLAGTGFAATKAYTIFMPATDIIKPGTAQELILFKIWAAAARPGADNGAEDGYQIWLSKEAFNEGRITEPVERTTYDGSAGDQFINVTTRTLLTDTEYYRIESCIPGTVDLVVEGLDKTLAGLFEEDVNTE